MDRNAFQSVSECLFSPKNCQALLVGKIEPGARAPVKSCLTTEGAVVDRFDIAWDATSLWEHRDGQRKVFDDIDGNNV